VLSTSGIVHVQVHKVAAAADGRLLVDMIGAPHRDSCGMPE
jgi:hypothetical protein